MRPEGPGGRSPPPPRRPNRSFRRRLKLRHSSSRSGGPWLPPGPRLPPWRPQFGSFSDMVARLQRNQFGRRVARLPRLRGLGDRAAKLGEPGASARAQKNAMNPTILVALDARGEARDIGLVPDQDLRDRAGADFREHLVHLGGLLLAYGRGTVHDVQQQV